MKRNVGLVVLPEEWKERFLARVETWEGESSVTKQQAIDRVKAELAALKSKIERVNNAFADGALEITEFKELKNPLVPKKVELEERLTVLERSKMNRLEPLRNWILEANQAEKPLSEENWLEMKSFLERVGSNRLLRAQTLTVSFKKPWNLLAETTLAVRRTNVISAQSSDWWSLMNDVRTSLKQNENMLHINAFVEFTKTCERRVV